MGLPCGPCGQPQLFSPLSVSVARCLRHSQAMRMSSPACGEGLILRRQSGMYRDLAPFPGNQLWRVGTMPYSASPRAHLTAHNSRLDIKRWLSVGMRFYDPRASLSPINHPVCLPPSLLRVNFRGKQAPECVSWSEKLMEGLLTHEKPCFLYRWHGTICKIWLLELVSSSSLLQCKGALSLEE